MPSTYSGSDTFPPNITIPSDGDDDSAAATDTPVEALADRTTWIKNRLTSTGGTVDFQNVTVHGNLEVLGGGHLLLDLFETATVQGDTTFQSCVVTIGSGAFIQFSGGGRIKPRSVVTTDADHHYTIADGAFFSVRAVTAFRHYTLDDAGAAEGDEMFWVADDAPTPGGAAAAQISAATGGANILIGTNSGVARNARWYFTNGHWRVNPGPINP